MSKYLDKSNDQQKVNKHDKINQLLLTEISNIIHSYIEFEEEVFVTISAVKAETNLSKARIYISVLPYEKSEFAIGTLVKNRLLIKQELAKIIPLRRVPNLIFLKDSTEEEASHTEKLLNNLD
jgi:ribosome-binding factor A